MSGCGSDSNDVAGSYGDAAGECANCTTKTAAEYYTSSGGLTDECSTTSCDTASCLSGQYVHCGGDIAWLEGTYVPVSRINSGDIVRACPEIARLTRLGVGSVSVSSSSSSRPPPLSSSSLSSSLSSTTTWLQRPPTPIAPLCQPQKKCDATCLARSANCQRILVTVMMAAHARTHARTHAHTQVSARLWSPPGKRDSGQRKFPRCLCELLEQARARRGADQQRHALRIGVRALFLCMRFLVALPSLIPGWCWYGCCWISLRGWCFGLCPRGHSRAT